LAAGANLANLWELSDIVNLSKTFVLVDEHPDSINDAAFAVQMVLPDAIERGHHRCAGIVP
jgi:hypothetical protein